MLLLKEKVLKKMKGLHFPFMSLLQMMELVWPNIILDYVTE